MKTTPKLCHGGSLILCVFIVCSTLMVGASSLLITSLGSYRNASNRTQRNRMLYAAEAGCQYALAALQSNSRAFETHPTTNDFARIGEEYRIVYSNMFAHDMNLALLTITEGAVYQTNLPDGMFKFMRASVKPIYVKVGVEFVGDEWKRPDTNVYVQVDQTIESRSVSVAEYGVFVDGDVTINSDKGTEITGAIHCNGTLRLGMSGGQTLALKNNVTASSNIYVTVGAANIMINLPGDLTAKAMTASGGVLDSSNAFWKTLAISTWQGRVKSGVHGVPLFKIPIPYVSDNPRILIEPQTNANEIAAVANVRYYNRASVRIIDDQVQKFDGIAGGTNNYLTIARLGQAGVDPWMSTGAFFYNTSISNYVRPLQIHVGNFVAWANANAPDSFRDDSKRAGLVYVYSNTNRPVRLTYADVCPASVVNGVTNGFTFVTGNSLYTWGNVNWPADPDLAVPVSCLSDSMTVLSEDWKDSDHDDPGDEAGKVNSVVHIWTSIVTGQSSNHFGTTDFFGGVECLPKYIEDFVGTGVSAKKDIRGSIVSLWESRGDLNNWVDPAKAPNRIWTYDPRFAYSVGVPRFYEFVPKNWKRVAGRIPPIAGTSY